MIALGCDHGGYELKQEIIKYLEEKKIPYKDFGCDSTQSVDYPIYARKVGRAIQSGECEGQAHLAVLFHGCHLLMV